MQVGLAGAGRIGEVHLRTLSRHPDVSEVLVHDADTERAEALAQQHGARAVGSWDVMLADIDALVVATPTETHADVLGRAIKHRVPAFCEKPVSNSLLDIERLALEAATSRTPVQVGFHYRFDPALRALAARLSQTDGPHQVRVLSTTEFAPTQEYLAGAGGLILDKLIHELDLVRWLTGSEVSHVCALAASDGHPPADPMTAALSLRLTDGGLAAIWGGYRSRAGFDLTVEVESRDGVAVVGNRRPVTQMPTPVGPSTVTDFRQRFARAYEAEIDIFLRVARGTEDSPSDLEEALRTHRLVEAARTALHTGTVVPVEDPLPRRRAVEVQQS